MGDSIVRRVAWSAALAASAAALLAALSTIVLASWLTQRAEDRRLDDAAVTFADELGSEGDSIDGVREVHRDESKEVSHTGMLLAVFDTEGRLLVGDPRVRLDSASGCWTDDSSALRACRRPASNGLQAVVAAVHSPIVPFLAGAGLVAALFAAALAWAVSRPLSRRVVAPLTRLREQVAQLDLDDPSGARLGAKENVLEVEALRSTLEQLVERVERSLSQAHRFAANAAHELKTPLTTVQAELDLLTESVSEPREREGASRARAKLSELSNLVERLLILSTPTRTLSDAYEVISLRDLLEDVVHALPEDARARVRLSEVDAQVRGDAALLSTMVANAIANGLKFGDTVQVELSVASGCAVLHLDDDGPGVAAAERERVFEPFFRSDDAVRRRVPGHGLGLALIRHVAEAHGGRAMLVGKPSPGARLEIRLPVS
jgi:signal transduction histidine kinase